MLVTTNKIRRIYLAVGNFLGRRRSQLTKLLPWNRSKLLIIVLTLIILVNFPDMAKLLLGSSVLSDFSLFLFWLFVVFYLKISVRVMVILSLFFLGQSAILLTLGMPSLADRSAGLAYLSLVAGVLRQVLGLYQSGY